MKKIIVIITVSFFLSNYANAQWQQTNGPFGGTINCMATAGDTLYAGTDDGVFYTIDNGNNWTKINNGLTDSNIISLAVIGNNLYAAGPLNGMFISKNGGKSWNYDSTLQYVNTLTISGTNIYAGSTDGAGISYSSDSGKTWKNISDSALLYGGRDINCILIKGKNIYLGTTAGLFFSNNNGNNWTNIGGLISYSITSLVFIDTFLFVGTAGGGLYMTYDNGKNWHIGSSGIVSNISSLIFTKGKMYAGTDQGVYLSSDKGYNWKPVNNGNALFYIINSLANIDSVVFSGTRYRGIFRTYDNASNWTQVNNVFNYYGVYSLVANDSNIFAGTRNGGLFISDKDVTKWTSINNGITNSIPSIQSIALNGSNIYLCLMHSGFYYSQDYGKNWIFKNDGQINSYPIHSLLSIGNYVLIGTDIGIYLSSDSGASWKNTSSVPTIYSFLQSKSGIFAGGEGYSGKYSIFYSIDSGKTWVPKSNGITKVLASSLAISGSNIVAGSNCGVFISEDNGNNWTKVNNGLKKDTNIFSVAIKGINIFVSTYHGVYFSSDKGQTWKKINEGLIDSFVYSLLIFNNNIYAGTDYSGVWVRSISDLSIENKINRINSISIYPNPARDKLFVKTSIYPNSKLEIIDLNGRVLEQLNFKNEESYIDISNLNNGLYILKIINDKGVMTTKFIKN